MLIEVYSQRRREVMILLWFVLKCDSIVRTLFIHVVRPRYTGQ